MYNIQCIGDHHDPTRKIDENGMTVVHRELSRFEERPREIPRTQGIQADAVDFNVYYWVPGPTESTAQRL